MLRCLCCQQENISIILCLSAGKSGCIRRRGRRDHEYGEKEEDYEKEDDYNDDGCDDDDDDDGDDGGGRTRNGAEAYMFILESISRVVVATSPFTVAHGCVTWVRRKATAVAVLHCTLNRALGGECRSWTQLILRYVFVWEDNIFDTNCQPKASSTSADLTLDCREVLPPQSLTVHPSKVTETQ